MVKERNDNRNFFLILNYIIMEAIINKKKVSQFPGINALRLGAVFFCIIWLYLYKTAQDHTDWWIENILVILFFAWLFFSRRRFVFSDTSLVFIFGFLVLHLYGAQGAYTHNGFGELLKAHFHLWRNPYDRIVHFSFGFLMAYPMLDIFSRWLGKERKGLFLTVNMAILSLATIFELIEWGVAAFTDKATGETYVATQGDPWDAQKDIIMALIGSLIFTAALKITRSRATNREVSTVKLDAQL